MRERTHAFDDMPDVKALMEDGRLEEALVVAEAQLPSRIDDADFLTSAREVFMRTGSVSLEAKALNSLRLMADSQHLQRRQQRVLSSLRETDPEWLPDAPIFREVEVQPGRVLHLLKASIPYRQSGYTMRSSYLLGGQKEVGLDPVAVTALGFPEDIGVTDFPMKEDIGGIKYLRLPRLDRAIDATSGDYLDAYVAAVAGVVADVRPSLIHVHSGHRGYEAALVGRTVAQGFGLPLVYEVRGFFESLWSPDPTWNERGELYWRRRETETRCMGAADAVVTLSETMRAEIVERGIPADKVFVVPNGVDPDRFFPAPRDTGLVSLHGTEGKFVFGYVSNLDHYREGQELLIEAASLLAARGVEAMAMIIGDGKRRQELEELAAQKGVSDSVVFTGQVPHRQVLAYYRLLDAFVVPRIPERAARLVSPLKPFEAMAAGVPVLVSDLPALAELVIGGRGMVFEAGNADALSDALEKLSRDPQRGKTLADSARAWVSAERSWTGLARRYANVYQRVWDYY